MADAGTVEGALFAFAALARVGAAVEFAIGAVVTVSGVVERFRTAAGIG
jgi:hypothetical protein